MKNSEQVYALYDEFSIMLNIRIYCYNFVHVYVLYDEFSIVLHAYVKTPLVTSCLQVLNQIVCELPSEHPLAETRPLRELLGHTPTQVCSNVLFTVYFTVIWQNESDGLLTGWLHGCQLNLFDIFA